MVEEEGGASWIRINWLHFRDEYHTPKSRFWPVHVAIHLLRLAKKKRKGVGTIIEVCDCGVFGLMWCLFCSANCSGTGKVITCV